MESINFIKGYGKVNNPVAADDQTSPHHHHNKPTAPNRHKAAVIFLLILLTLLVAATVAGLIYNSTTNKSPESTTIPSQSFSANQAETIRTVCSVTQYSNSCITAISSLKNLPPKPDPELIFTLSLNITIVELKNISSLPETLISKSNDPRAGTALRDCVSLFDDAVSQLSNSVTSMVEGPGEKVLTEVKIRDVNTWISAAMTDQDTCLDGLEEMGSTVLDEVRMKVQRSKEYMSNSLAILANMHALLDKFGLTMY